MHDLEKYLTPTSIKGNSYEADHWKFSDQELSVNNIRFAVKDGIPLSIQNELEDNKEDYRSLTHEDWCDLLSTIKFKDNKKREAT